MPQQALLHFFKGDAFGLGHHQLHPDKLQDHHAAEEQEDITGSKRGDHFGEKRGEQGGKDPMSEAAQRLAFGAMAVGKNLGDKYPDDRALSNGVGADERKNAGRDNGKMFAEECPRSEEHTSELQSRFGIS